MVVTMSDMIHPAALAEPRQRNLRALSDEDVVRVVVSTPKTAERHLLEARVQVSGAGIERLAGRKPKSGEKWVAGCLPGSSRFTIFSGDKS